MKSTLLATVLFLAATSACSARHGYVGPPRGGYYGPGPVSVYGPPPPPRGAAYRPACPGPGYVWVSGYWYPSGRDYRWQSGRWMRPPRAGMVWVAPRYSGRSYHGGYWRR
ncbi:MAG: YXWGXW repeat-containing protein [Bryobacteraceae bacterium]|nr:YXWGXW repeat-containing protein [Bryobacteraceae bacterium]